MLQKTVEKYVQGLKKSANITIQIPICILIMNVHFSTLNSGGCVLLIFSNSIHLIIVQAINKRAGRKFLWKKINVQYLIRPCRLEILIKINNRAACLFRTLEYINYFKFT